VEHEAKQHPAEQEAKGGIVEEAEDIITTIARSQEDGGVPKGPQEKTSSFVRGEEGTLGATARRMNRILCMPCPCVCGDGIP